MQQQASTGGGRLSHQLRLAGAERGREAVVKHGIVQLIIL